MVEVTLGPEPRVERIQTAFPYLDRRFRPRSAPAMSTPQANAVTIARADLPKLAGTG